MPMSLVISRKRKASPQPPEILPEFVERGTLRMCAGKSWDVADIQSGVQAILHDCRKRSHPFVLMSEVV
jgi:hypothetical protein